MAVATRPRKTGPSTFDRILQVIGAGTSVFGTVKGIQQRQKGLELSERGLELAEERDLAQRGKELNELYHGTLLADRARRIEENPERKDAAILRTLNVVQNVVPDMLISQGRRVPEPIAFNTALVASQIAERNEMIDATQAPEALATSFTIDQIIDPFFNAAYRKIKGEELGMAPEDVPGSTIIQLGNFDAGDLTDAQLAAQILALPPEEMRTMASVRAGQLLGKDMPLEAVLAGAEHTIMKVGEAQNLLAAGDPKGLELLHRFAGVAESPDIAWDPGRAVTDALGLSPGQRLNITTSEQTGMAQSAWMFFLRQQLDDEGGARDALQKAEEQYAGLLISKGVQAAEATFISRRCANSYDEAINEPRCGLGDMTREEYDAKPQITAMHEVANRFGDYHNSLMTAAMMGASEQFDPFYRSARVMRDWLGLDPTSNGDRKEAKDILEGLNAYEVSKGGRPIYAIPQLDEDSGIFGWFMKADWIQTLEDQGMLDPTQVYGRDGGFPGAAQPPPPANPATDIEQFSALEQYKLRAILRFGNLESQEERADFIARLEAAKLPSGQPVWELLWSTELNQLRVQAGLPLPGEGEPSPGAGGRF